jgi:hypothetical protein
MDVETIWTYGLITMSGKLFVGLTFVPWTKLANTVEEMSNVEQHSDGFIPFYCREGSKLVGERNAKPQDLCSELTNHHAA